MRRDVLDEEEVRKHANRAECCRPGLGPESGCLDGNVRQDSCNDVNQSGKEGPHESDGVVHVDLTVGKQDHRVEECLEDAKREHTSQVREGATPWLF